MLSQRCGSPSDAATLGIPMHYPAMEVRLYSEKSKMEAQFPPPPVKMLPAPIQDTLEKIRLLTPPPFPPGSPEPRQATTEPGFGITGTLYFPTSSLTVHPRPLGEPDMHLPHGWLEAYGKAILTLYIGADGKVVKVVVDRTELPAEFHSEIIRAFQSLSFEPGEIDGRPVPVMMKIEADLSSVLGNRY